MEQFCAKWGCDRKATYDKPLCYEHWCEFEAWDLEECNWSAPPKGVQL